MEDHSNGATVPNEAGAGYSCEVVSDDNDSFLVQGETNFDDVGCDDADIGEFPDYLCDLSTEEEQVVGNSTYCKRWIGRCGLKVLKPDAVQGAFASKGFLGVFMLFLHRSLFEAIHSWTLPVLRRRGYDASFTLQDLYAYIGLEIASSLTKVPVLSEMWSTKMFCGLEDFRRVMSRDTFKLIRCTLRLYPSYDHDIAVRDPLWHSRIIMEHFCRNCASVAAPLGITSFDENTIR